jgi:hypothetical protein
MSDIKALKSYLVSLGFNVNQSQLNAFNNALVSASDWVAKFTKNAGMEILKWEGIAVSAFASVGAAAVLAADKIASKDQDYRLWGETMFMTASHARVLKQATDALGYSMGQIAMDPELFARAKELVPLIQQLERQQGPNVEHNLQMIRSARMEFTKLQLEATYFLRMVISQVVDALGGEKFIDRLRAFNDYIMAHLPEWSKIIADDIVPILKDAQMIMGDIWQLMKDLAQVFTNFVGLITGDASLTGAVSMKKFADAVAKVVHYLAMALHFLINIQATLATGAIGAFLGGGIGTAVGGIGGAALGSLFGPVGTVIGGAAGAGLGGIAGAVGGGLIGAIPGAAFDTYRHFNPAGGAGFPGGSGANSADVKALAQKVGSDLGVNPALVYGQWMHETGGLTNRGARELNNLAGIRIPGSTQYQSYSSLGEFASAYEGLMTGRYKGVLSAQTPEQWAAALKNRGYMEDTAAHYAAGMRSGMAGYGGGVQIGSINIMQPNASPKQVADAVAEGVRRQQSHTTLQQMNQMKSVYG